MIEKNEYVVVSEGISSKKKWQPLVAELNRK